PQDYPRFLCYLVGSRGHDIVLVSHCPLAQDLLPYLAEHCPDVSLVGLSSNAAVLASREAADSILQRRLVTNAIGTLDARAAALALQLSDQLIRRQSVSGQARRPVTGG